jgi:hypothetical protein
VAVLSVSLPLVQIQCQDLTPRAYLITPSGMNAVVMAYSHSAGSVFADTAVPIEDFRARLHLPSLSFYRAFSLLGRSANLAVALPYASGDLRATAGGAEAAIRRSGLADTRFRLSVNLLGAPAMRLAQFVQWREKSTLGASVTVAAPTGQHDPAKLVNPGLNRWAFKPEIGLARRFGNWTLDLYGGGWFFTSNKRFFPGNSRREQSPVAAGEAHLIRYLNRRCWLSLDTNYWIGGQTRVNGAPKDDYQRSSRVGTTFALPLNENQTLKFSYSRGAYIRIGGDYRNLSMAWQYSWIRGL